MRAVVVGPLLLVVALAGCGSCPKPAPAAPCALAPPAVPPVAAAPAPAAAPAQESLAEHVPARAAAVLAVRRNALAWPLAFLASAPEMHKELSAYLTREVGIDPTQIEGAVAYTTNIGARSGAVFLRLRAAGALRGRPAGQHQGVPLVEVAPMVVAAAVPGGVVIGVPSEVAAAIDLAQRRTAPVAPGSFLGQALAQPVDFLAAVSVAGLADPAVAGLVQQFGVDGAVLTFRGDGVLTLRVDGDPARLGAVREIFRATGTMLVEEAARRKARLEQGHDVLEAVGAIVGYSMAQRTFREIEPRLQGRSLISEYRLPKLDSATTMIMWTGIAAAVAIPAFTKYTHKAKTTEVHANLAALRAAVTRYHAEHRKDKRFAFPATTPWSPAVDCCKQRTAPKCAPGLGAFSHPTWKALGFDLTEPFRYQYRFTSEGKGKKARFAIEARGDLECNNVLQLHRITGHLDAKGELVIESTLDVKHAKE
jgi:type II secretory pathway pseudopilin PulG